MTKRVRVENADLSDFVVIVEVWEKGQEKDVLVETIELPHSTCMTGNQYPDVYIHDSRYLIVREK